MILPEIEVFVRSGYGGKVDPYVMIDNEKHILELEWLENYLKENIEEKGYTTSINKRQKYPRIIINL